MIKDVFLIFKDNRFALNQSDNMIISSFICFDTLITIYQHKEVSVISKHNQTIPNLKKGNLKFWWDQEMEVLKQNSIGSFRAWQSAGKPKFGDIHDQMRIHRLRYRKEIKDRDNKTVLEVSNALHDALMKKIPFLSGKLGKINLGNNSEKITVEGFSDENVICNEFANFFQNACTSNSLEVDQRIKAEFEHRFSKLCA